MSYARWDGKKIVVLGKYLELAQARSVRDDLSEAIFLGETELSSCAKCGHNPCRCSPPSKQ